jgi:cyclase
VAERVMMPLSVGGGVRTVADVRRLLVAGADKVAMNTAAIADPELVARAADRFGAQAIVVAVDARREPEGGWRVYTHGGRNRTELDAVAWCARVAELGAGEILLTSMDRDGTRAGYDLDLLAAVTRSVSVPVIASGGAGTLEHLYEGLTTGGADAVLVASLFHFREHSIRQAKEYLTTKGVVMRV